MINPLDFNGKVALVTGAASGMGLATARAFAEAGAAVVLADFKGDAVEAEAQKLVAAGHKAIAVRCDVLTFASISNGTTPPGHSVALLEIRPILSLPLSRNAPPRTPP